MPETVSGEAAGIQGPPIPLKDIVTAKLVVCLEWREDADFKDHLRKAHGLTPRD